MLAPPSLYRPLNPGPNFLLQGHYILHNTVFNHFFTRILRKIQLMMVFYTVYGMLRQTKNEVRTWLM